MQKPKVFVTRRLPGKGLDLLAQFTDLEVWPGDLPPAYELILEKAAGVDGLLCLLSDRIDRAVLAASGGRLKVVSQYAVGFDNIDVHAATELGIAVGNTPGALTEATADFAWALLMAAARRVVEADKLTRAGGWKTWGPQFLVGPEVYGATLGIVGLGRIGQAVARRARGFSMRILYYNLERVPQAEEELGVTYVPFEQLLSESDFITLHTTLNPTSRNLIGETQLRQMKPSAILVNTARGTVVDQPALYRALRDKVIAYAAVDVTEKEPIPLDDPLLTLDNLVIAPHIASGGIKARNVMSQMAAENLLAGLRGERLPNCANPEVYREKL